VEDVRVAGLRVCIPADISSAQSTALNQSRLEVLRKRDEHLSDLFEKADNEVKALANGKDYPKAVEQLILEVLLMLTADNVTLAHRPKDEALFKKASVAANKQYKEMAGRGSTIELHASLPDDSAGGVIGSTMAGRIKIDNTLSARLHILEEKMLPELRADLFGANPNRKFFDVSRLSLDEGADVLSKAGCC
jgi:V-type H+-transporting ATPase subunit E